jgi:K+-transporting ATPase ATPase A chain
MLWQFISAASGIAVCAALFNAMKSEKKEALGNFYVYFIRTCVRLLFPIALTGALILIFNGSPMTFEGKDKIVTLEGETQYIARGPVAAFTAIKQLGTNGGGFFGTNSCHPMENPSTLSNLTENIFILLIPIAMVFACGFYLKNRRFAFMVFGVMATGFLCLLIPTVYFEMSGSANIEKMGFSQHLGSMEGKETRVGSAASALWAISTTCTSNGSVNAMHDSLTPLSGMTAMLGMMINSFFGGAGVGFINFYVFIILAVFMGGLMVGRTPEFFGKKVEAKEIKIAVLITILHPFTILASTALSVWLFSLNPSEYASWLKNPSFHGFSEILYEFCSASANNGSGFEGLGDNTPFWNLSTGFIMLLNRYLPIIGPLAIAGSLASKKYIPQSAGTLRLDTWTFGVLLFAVIGIVAALSFFPTLALGPIADFLTVK